eukprot:GHVN01001521.1.p1 GENE.GHVN01001521.1~~GHVN01001521.1.p1  ORF type:complete len:825 (+),score=126.39 GHVN01001521.1:983-3457(+)
MRVESVKNASTSEDSETVVVLVMCCLCLISVFGMAYPITKTIKRIGWKRFGIDVWNLLTISCMCMVTASMSMWIGLTVTIATGVVDPLNSSSVFHQSTPPGYGTPLQDGELMNEMSSLLWWIALMGFNTRVVNGVTIMLLLLRATRHLLVHACKYRWMVIEWTLRALIVPTTITIGVMAMVYLGFVCAFFILGGSYNIALGQFYYSMLTVANSIFGSNDVIHPLHEDETHMLIVLLFFTITFVVLFFSSLIVLFSKAYERAATEMDVQLRPLKHSTHHYNTRWDAIIANADALLTQILLTLRCRKKGVMSIELLEAEAEMDRHEAEAKKKEQQSTPPWVWEYLAQHASDPSQQIRRSASDGGQQLSQTGLGERYELDLFSQEALFDAHQDALNDQFNQQATISVFKFTKTQKETDVHFTAKILYFGFALLTLFILMTLYQLPSSWDSAASLRSVFVEQRVTVTPQDTRQIVSVETVYDVEGWYHWLEVCLPDVLFVATDSNQYKILFKDNLPHISSHINSTNSTYYPILLFNWNLGLDYHFAKLTLYPVKHRRLDRSAALPIRLINLNFTQEEKGGGMFRFLPSDRDELIDLVSQMVVSDVLGNDTIKAVLEGFFVSPNTDMIAQISLTFPITNGGRVYPDIVASTYSLLPFSTIDFICWGLWGICVVIIVILDVNLLCKWCASRSQRSASCCSSGCAYLFEKDLWEMTELMVLIFSVLLLVYGTSSHVTSFELPIDSIHEAWSSMAWCSEWWRGMREVSGWLVFLSLLRIVTFLKKQRGFSVIVTTVTSASSELFCLVSLFACLSIGLVFFTHLTLGADSEVR